MKKKLALAVAGASAALIAGFRLVQERAAHNDVAVDPVAVAPGVAAEAGPKPPQASRTSSAAPAKGASKAELYETAQELEIEGRSKMTKGELIEAIEKAS